MNQLTAQQVAERLGVTVRRVQAMVKDGRLPATRFGRALVIRESDLSLVQHRAAGRPKTTPDTNKRAGGRIRASDGASTGKKKGKGKK
jgi:excisionase family DNA binding protein